ncbi:NfeD family protein [Chloroflexota bacterium]
MPFGKNKRSLALFFLITSIIEEAVLLVVLVWLLPFSGLSLPLWFILLILIAWAGSSYLSFWIAKKNAEKKPVTGVEAMVGTACRTTTSLCPTGYVQAGTELWRARSNSGDIAADVEVMITEIKGLTIYVNLSSDSVTNKELDLHPATLHKK